MESKPSRNKEDYANLYEYRKQCLSASERTTDDERYYPCISYFCKQNGTPVSGKVFKPPSPEFKCEVDIKKCFIAIKEKMTTKAGQPRKAMLKLADYEVTAWAALLEYLRSEWSLGNKGKVLLTYKEYYMLFPKKQNKKK